MPGIAYWIKRYLLAATTMFALLLVVNLIKGSRWQDGAQEALIWGMVSAAIFIGSHYHRTRKGIACALCDNLDRALEKKAGK
ncbi:MAG: hypothetical protein V4857_01105 [Pseudomonadota bacterium]